MKSANYDFILPFYTSTDEIRPAMHNPSLEEDGYVYATNAHILIRIKEELLSQKYEKQEKFPKAANFFDERLSTCDKKLTVSTDRLIEIVSLAKMRNPIDKRMCEKCDGGGIVECPECKNEHPCKECRGDGYIQEDCRQFSLLQCDDHSIIKIANHYFDADLIHKLVITAKMIDATSIEMAFSEKKGYYNYIIASFAEIDIVIMGRTVNEETELKELLIGTI